MRAAYALLLLSGLLSACWVTDAEVREKVAEYDVAAETGDTG